MTLPITPVLSWSFTFNGPAVTLDTQTKDLMNPAVADGTAVLENARVLRAMREYIIAQLSLAPLTGIFTVITSGSYAADGSGTHTVTIQVQPDGGIV